MNLQDVFYHGVRHQVRRVLTRMSDVEIEAGLTAFETGASNWSSCFFARALATSGRDLRSRPEIQIMEHLGLDSLIPIRMVWCTFDGAGISMTKDQLKQFIKECRTSDDGISDEALAFLKSIDYTDAESREATDGITCL